MVLRAFWADSGLSAGLAGANEKLQQLGRSGPGAPMGLRLVEQGARTLAFQAAGVGGPLGRISAGLLQLGGGQALVVGAVAGIGLIVGAYKAATAETDELTAATDKLNQTWRDILARGKPLVGLQNEIIKATQQQTDAQAKLDQLLDRQRRLEPGERNSTGAAILAGNIVGAQAQVDAATRQITALRSGRPDLIRQDAKTYVATFLAAIKDLSLDQQLARVTSNETEFRRRGTEAAQAWSNAYFDLLDKKFSRPFAAPRATTLGAAVDAQGRSLTPLQQFSGAGPAGGGTVSNAPLAAWLAMEERAGVILRGLITPQQRFNDEMNVLSQSLEWGAMTAKERKIAEDELRKSVGLTAHVATVSAAAMITAASGLAAMFAGGGGSAGGFLSGIGGILGLIPGVGTIGAVVSGIGGVISASESRGTTINGYSPRALDQMKNAGGGPDRVVVQIISSSTGELLDQIEYELGRRTRLDRIIRIPRGAAMVGA